MDLQGSGIAVAQVEVVVAVEAEKEMDKVLTVRAVVENGGMLLLGAVLSLPRGMR